MKALSGTIHTSWQELHKTYSDPKKWSAIESSGWPDGGWLRARLHVKPLQVGKQALASRQVLPQPLAQHVGVEAGEARAHCHIRHVLQPGLPFTLFSAQFTVRKQWRVGMCVPGEGQFGESAGCGERGGGVPDLI